MNDDFIIIENESKVYRIKKNEIFSIEVNSGILTFRIDDGRKLTKTMTLKKGLEILPCFIKIYRNIAINKHRIKEICKTNRMIRLDNNVEFNVSSRNISKIRLADNKLRLAD